MTRRSWLLGRGPLAVAPVATCAVAARADEHALQVARNLPDFRYVARPNDADLVLTQIRAGRWTLMTPRGKEPPR